jgi:hypothetical protein
MTAPTPRARTFTLLLIGVFSAIALLGLTLTTARASAVFQEIAETGRPGYLKLGAHSATPLQAKLRPGESTHWLIEASLLDAERSTLAVELDASGELLDVSEMTAQITACAGAFEFGASAGSGAEFEDAEADIRCLGERTAVLPPTSLLQLVRNGDRFTLAELRRGAPRQLLVQLSIPASADADALADRTARIGLGVHADGEDVARPAQPVTPREPRLPVTGADALALGVLAVGLIGLGGSLALRRRACPAPSRRSVS